MRVFLCWAFVSNKTYLCPFQPGSCAWFSPLLWGCALIMHVYLCVCENMRVWKWPIHVMALQFLHLLEADCWRQDYLVALFLLSDFVFVPCLWSFSLGVFFWKNGLEQLALSPVITWIYYRLLVLFEYSFMCMALRFPLIWMPILPIDLFFLFIVLGLFSITGGLGKTGLATISGWLFRAQFRQALSPNKLWHLAVASSWHIVSDGSGLHVNAWA